LIAQMLGVRRTTVTIMAQSKRCLGPGSRLTARLSHLCFMGALVITSPQLLPTFQQHGDLQ
jgi:hypothetical protein